MPERAQLYRILWSGERCAILGRRVSNPIYFGGNRKTYIFVDNVMVDVPLGTRGGQYIPRTSTIPSQQISQKSAGGRMTICLHFCVNR